MKKVGHLLAGKLLPFGRISTSFGSCMSESHRVPCTSGCPCSVRGGLFPMEASSLAFACLTQPGLPWPPVMPTVGGSLTHTSPPCGAGTHRPACAGPLRAGFAAPSTAVPVRPLPPPPGLAAVPQAPPPPASGAAPRTGLQVRTPAGGSWLEWAVEWVGPCRPQGGGAGAGLLEPGRRHRLHSTHQQQDGAPGHSCVVLRALEWGWDPRQRWPLDPNPPSRLGLRGPTC